MELMSQVELSGKMSGWQRQDCFIALTVSMRLVEQLYIPETTKTGMKSTYWLFKRGSFFYTEDTRTGKQQSLKTTDKDEASRLLAAKNEAANKHTLALAVGQIYLNATGPALMTRTWSDVMKVMTQRGGESTQARTKRALESKPFNIIRQKVIHETHSTDFLDVLKDKRRSTIHYLRLLQTMAMNLGWLNGREILAKHCWPLISAKPKRAITRDEHQKIIAAEKTNKERRLYYEMLWEIGASQTDAATLSRDNVFDDVLVYVREKTGTQANIRIGGRLKNILAELPKEGMLFPLKIASLNSVARSAEFNRRCRLLGIKGRGSNLILQFFFRWGGRNLAGRGFFGAGSRAGLQSADI